MLTRSVIAVLPVIFLTFLLDAILRLVVKWECLKQICTTCSYVKFGKFYLISSECFLNLSDDWNYFSCFGIRWAHPNILIVFNLKWNHNYYMWKRFSWSCQYFCQQDKSDDITLGMKSTALRFGSDTKTWLAG